MLLQPHVLLVQHAAGLLSDSESRITNNEAVFVDF
jgi:hypothetical protein